MIYKIRVILNTQDDVFRDIEIRGNQSLGKLHEGIKSAFSLQGDEMSAFYYSDNEWNQQEEIPLEDMSDDGTDDTMYDLTVKEVLTNTDSKLIYVYDFLVMWSFFVEVVEIMDKKPTLNYPLTVYRYGKMPLKAPSKKFEAPDISFDKDDDLDLEDTELEIDPDLDFEGLEFDED